MWTINGLAAALEDGDTSSRELVEASLERIADQHGEGARAFLKVYIEEARGRAETVDRARKEGRSLPPYAGIPISVKDLFDESGEVTRAGSTVLSFAAPAIEDAPAVARLRAAGFIVIGRTNMTEFAYSGIGMNPHYGTPLNPFERDLGRIPGGSSSGAAVSVADAMVVAGLGTDTGGSCRIPAALCGIVGYKPTAARVPLGGVVPLSSSLDAVGALATSVECCRILDGVLAGTPACLAEERPLGGLRLGVPQSLVLDSMDDHVSEAFEATLSALSEAGAVVRELPLEELSRLPGLNAKGGLAAAEAHAWHRGLVAERGGDYDPRVRVRIEKGASQSAADYIDLLKARADMIERVGARTSSYDALVLPTVPRVAPTLAELEDDAVFGEVNLLMLRNPSVVNFLDGCAISLPCHEPASAPVGVMLAAQRGMDHRLLAIAASVERLLRPGG